jgi:hypothetical protein
MAATVYTHIPAAAAYNAAARACTQGFGGRLRANPRALTARYRR